jgi:hypothetical protein
MFPDGPILSVAELLLRHANARGELVGVPTTYRELIGAARADARPLPRLRVCITAGAPVPADLKRGGHRTPRGAAAQSVRQHGDLRRDRGDPTW